MGSDLAGKPEISPEILLEHRLAALESAVQRVTWTRVLDLHLPSDRRVAIVTDRPVRPEALGRPAVAVVPDPTGSVAGVARLEARRGEGMRHVFVPETVWPVLEHDAQLIEHLQVYFVPVATEPGVGTLFEPSAEPAPEIEMLPLAALIDRRIGDQFVPMLDWTSLGMERFLPGRTLFRPVDRDDGALPYLDDTIDVVLVDDAGRMEEATRVAAGMAILVTADEGGSAILLQTRTKRSGLDGGHPPVSILVEGESDDEWPRRLAEILAGRPGLDVEAAVDPARAAAETDAPIVVLAERGVVPLPRCIEAAAGVLAAEERVGGVAVKLFDSEGSLAAAGGAAFADGSVGDIAAGAPEAAPWHEYVRPVPAAVGMIMMRPAAAQQCARDARGLDLADLSARVWSNGWELRYQPDAAAVRAVPPARLVQGAGTWTHRSDRLPARPADLDDSAWRRLLVSDEVRAAL
jgi:hypothetical protein